jgi:UDP-2,3-diacylglucosamine pyrophosphatase LpxH
LNRHYNNYRRKKGLPYYSLSQVVKQKVKTAVSFISDYEEELCAVARTEKCDGVICGHIHQPANKEVNGIHYLNSGDWVETLSAITENEYGEWNIIYYNDWLLHKKENTLHEKELASQRENEFWENLELELINQS